MLFEQCTELIVKSNGMKHEEHRRSGFFGAVPPRATRSFSEINNNLKITLSSDKSGFHPTVDGGFYVFLTIYTF